MLDAFRSYEPEKTSGTFARPTTAAAVISEQTGILFFESCFDRLLGEGLEDSSFRVTSIRHIRELFFLRGTLSLALLSDSLGMMTLDSAARMIRSQWPLAHILILGTAAGVLDDHLHDDSIPVFCSTQDLVAMLTKLSRDLYHPSGRPFILPSPVNETSCPPQIHKSFVFQQTFAHLTVCAC